MKKTELSYRLGCQIVLLSPYLQAVQEVIKESIKHQKSERVDSQLERECRLKRGQREASPGVWRMKGSKVNLYEFMTDYPVKSKEEEKKK